MPEKFYITTSITYASKPPHIGNCYEAVFTDALARFHRLRGDDVYFLTGTDEHGQKIQKQAEAEGITPQAHVDKIASGLRDTWDLLQVQYDGFIRTTDANHKATVQKIFKRFLDNGDLYKSSYEGYYCLPCEAFYTETQIKDAQGVCPNCGAPVERAREEGYFFKLSKYADRLMKHIEENPDFIRPESRKNEMINNFLKPGLQDLCVSRTSFTWGVPVPFDEGHVIYVWVDALSNYITALGYDPEKPQQSGLFARYWPAQAHVIGKDILRFHTLYWPIMLMALDLPLPQTVLGHPWLMIGDDKISKSKGNAVYAEDMAADYGVDAVRYYLLREMPYAQDGSLTLDAFVARCNADLSNNLGNLLSRTTAMTVKYFGGTLPARREHTELDAEVQTAALKAAEGFARHMTAFQTANALEESFKLVSRANKFIDETEPWKLAKDDASQPRLAGVLYTLLEALRVSALLLTPILPGAAGRMWEALGLKDRERRLDDAMAWGELDGYAVAAAEPLFPRIERKEP
jgi:methionyl-tRNA synthetase